MRIAALKPVLAATTLLLLTHATQATTLTFSGIFDQRFGEELLFFSPGNPYSGAFDVAEPVTTGQIGSATSIALAASSFSYGVYDQAVRKLQRGTAWARAKLPRGVRTLIGILLVIVGFFGFLPILGFWMIPLGLAFIALDIPPLRRRLTGWLRRNR